MQCPKTGSWESIGTVLEMRPDKLSYLIEVQGKMFVRARYMLRPVEEGGPKLILRWEFYLGDQNVSSFKRGKKNLSQLQNVWLKR